MAWDPYIVGNMCHERIAVCSVNTQMLINAGQAKSVIAIAAGQPRNHWAEVPGTKARMHSTVSQTQHMGSATIERSKRKY